MEKINLKGNVSFSGFGFLKKKQEDSKSKVSIQDGDKKSMEVLDSISQTMKVSVKKQDIDSNTFKTPLDILTIDKITYDKLTMKPFTGTIKAEGGYKDSTYISTYFKGKHMTSVGMMNDGRIYYSFDTKKDGTRVEETFFVTKEKGMEYDGSLTSRKIMYPDGSYEKTDWLAGIDEPMEVKTVDNKNGLIITDNRMTGKTVIDNKKGTFSIYRKDGTLDRVQSLKAPKISTSMYEDGETVKTISYPNGDYKSFRKDGTLDFEFKDGYCIMYNNSGKEISRTLKK